MKRVILICIILFATYNIYAQSNSEKMGDTAFSMGNYADAIELYDAAIILSKDRVDKIQAKRSKAAKCNSLKKTGDSLYASKDYEESKSKYLQLKSLNPSDKSVSDKLAILDRLITERKSQEAKAENMAQIENSYYDALRLGVEALEKFREKYPDSEQIHKTDVAINALKMEKYSCSPTEISLYNQIGNDFKRIGDTDKARKFYDFSASLANPEGLYLKALTYDNITAIEPLSLLVLSSVAGGYEPAKDKLSSVIGNCKYDTNVAKTLYKHLCNYSTDLESFVYVYENRATYPIERLNLAESAKLHFQNLTTTKEIKYDDNLIYQFATIVEKNLKMEAELLYNMAASKGNIDALRRVYEMKKGSLKYENRQAFEDFLTHYNLVGYKSYLKYLRGEHMTSGDWNGIYSYCYDKHEELLAESFSMRYNFDHKFYKKWIVRKNDNSLWDKEIIEEVKEWASYYSPKYAKRIIKLVSKLKTADGIYDISANPIYQFVEAGLSDNPHSYNQSIKKEKLWTIAPSNNKTSKSAPRQTSSSSSTTYKPTTASKKDTYYVGQDLGEGYVFAVNDTGTHGLIVSKDINAGKPDSKLSYKAATKYKWRMPTESELYRIGKTLKDKFPVAGYLAYNGSGYKCVNFSKKNVYTATVNYSYIYRVLYVAEF